MSIKSWLMMTLAAAFGGTILWAQGLSPAAQKVVDYLLADWEKHMRSTSISQAMANLDMELDDDLRLKVGEHFRAHPELHMNLRSWGANNYILSDQEKRIAKFLIGRFEADGKLPTDAEAAQGLEMDAADLSRGLNFLKRAGFLEAAEGRPGYQLTAKYRRWGGPLRFNYHTITIGEEDPFAVW